MLKIHRPDNTFVIEKNFYPFHVTPEMPEYSELLTEFEQSPENFNEDFNPEIPDIEADYKVLRLAEYPEPGDFIDAYCKAQAGDDTELKALMARREQIKLKYPKK